MWNSSFMRPTCSGVMPEKQNMPIWLVTWSQLRTEPSLARLALSESRMVMMRSAMLLHSAYHWGLSLGSSSTVATMRAPWMGGLEYMGRMMILSCERMRSASSVEDPTKEKHPMRSPYRPKFLAKDWATHTSLPSATKLRSAHASLSASPEAKPWYAVSMKSVCFLALQAAEISFHCSCVGSTPVGLCAHAWNMNTDPSGAALTSSMRPAMSRPTVFLS
mmetsp:Transcript_68/g.228  ORF Transcript_68/g.228 Transcript_68/m.228 type:complete len:219 (-) Transcript_68:574-1230(-)